MYDSYVHDFLCMTFMHDILCMTLTCMILISYPKQRPSHYIWRAVRGSNLVPFFSWNFLGKESFVFDGQIMAPFGLFDGSYKDLLAFVKKKQRSPRKETFFVRLSLLRAVCDVGKSSSFL